MSNTGLIYIQGRLFPKTVEGIVSSAEHIYDPNIQLDEATEVGAYQTAINEALKNMVTSAKSLVINAVDASKIAPNSDGSALLFPYLGLDSSTSISFKTINGNSILGSGNIVVSGNGSIDMGNYYTKEEADALIEDKIELVQIVDRNTGDGPELEFYKSNEDHIYIKISDILSGLESIDDESIDNLFV